jgi:hypothetical protein
VNRRQAKREACFRAALVLEGALAGGWESLDRYGPGRTKVEDALNELIAELERRAGTSVEVTR